MHVHITKVAGYVRQTLGYVFGYAAYGYVCESALLADPKSHVIWSRLHETPGLIHLATAGIAFVASQW
jgi:hypothetical protein